MAIVQCKFENEAELEKWVFQNLTHFLGDCMPLEKFTLVTASGKGGVPDGFVFNFVEREWCLIECKLLKHGVWPHIAEQISRLVVAVQNPDTLRSIRDRLFEKILASGRAKDVAIKMETAAERLMQQLELFVEGVQPNIVIFIDETNQDLSDFAHALATPVQVYRVNKFLVNGVAEYYSPDQQAPAVTTSPPPVTASGSQDYSVVEALGGGSLLSGRWGFTCYKLNDGRIIHIKRSKFYERQEYYWYGVNPNTLAQAHELRVTHIVFVMGEWGFTVVPLDIVDAFCKRAKTTDYPDGTARHYHVLISREPEPEMYWSDELPRYDLTGYSQPFA